MLAVPSPGRVPAQHGSSVSTTGCPTVAALFSQSGGVATVKFSGGTAGSVYVIGLNFSTGNVVGEAKPGPGSTVRYLSTARGSTPELDLVKQRPEVDLSGAGGESWDAPHRCPA